MGYSNTGPFSDNAAPALSAAFFNNVENFLDTVNSMATDTHNSSDGSGNATVVSISLAHGKISRIAYTKCNTVTSTPKFFNHNLGATPDFCMVSVLGTSGAVFAAYWDDASMTSTQVKLTSNSSSGISVALLAVKM